MNGIERGGHPMGLILLLAIGLIIYAFWSPKNVGLSGGQRSAMEILRERYAKGEIDEDEYNRRKQTLDGK